MSRHARKRAILVRIPWLGGREAGEAFRRSRPLFRSLVRGKLISFIRGGDEGGGRRQRERRGGEGETSFCSQARGSAKFYFGRVPRKDYPYRENMEVKGASRKRGLSSSFESISNHPLHSSRSRLARPEFVPPTPPTPPPTLPATEGSTFSISRCEYIRRDGGPLYLILWLINSRVGGWRGSRDIYFVDGEREKAFECFPLDVSGDYILFISLCPSGSSLVPYINYTGRNAVDNYL